LTFVNREANPHEGVQTQEVLRALIDRTLHCDRCLRWDGNDKIIHHLRMALALHEARAIERKTEKGGARSSMAWCRSAAVAHPTDGFRSRKQAICLPRSFDTDA
jgi:hypothetical protein